MGPISGFFRRKGKRAILLVVMVLLLGLLSWSILVAAEEDATESTETRPAVAALQSAYTVSLPAVMRDYPPPPPLFGVVMPVINDSNGLAQAVQAGVYWADHSAFSWAGIEPSRTEPPTYNWGAVEEQSLINAAPNGLVVIARVHLTPPWARELPSHNCSRIKRDSLEEFAQFLTALVNRYKEAPYNVKYWELDSEVDVDPALTDPSNPQGFWCWGDQYDPYYGGGYFAEMLQWAYPAIKAADPQAQVVIGGLLLDCDPRNPPPGKTCQSSRFLEGVLRGGGGSHFDTVSFHAYAYYGGTLGQMGNPNWTGGVWKQSTAVLEKASFVRQVLSTYGYGNKGIMNMEAALFCEDDPPASPDCLQTQAMYVPRAYAEAMASGVMAQAWFWMKDPVWRSTGLLDALLNPKPVYYAYQFASRELSHARYVGPVGDYAPGVAGYSFISGTQRIQVVWSADNFSHNISPPSGFVRALDKYGVSVGGSPVSVGVSPVYLEFSP